MTATSQVADRVRIDGDALVATDTDPVVFYAKGEAYRMVRQHGRTLLNVNNGGFYDDPDHPSIVVEFKPKGRIEVMPGEGLHVDGKGWLADTQELERRGLPADQQVPRDLVTAMRSHKGYNVDFYEEGAEPGMPQPTPDKFMGLLTDFTVAFDVENLEGLLETEKSSHNRPMLVKAAQSALDKVKQAYADAEAQQADAEKSGKK